MFLVIEVMPHCCRGPVLVPEMRGRRLTAQVQALQAQAAAVGPMVPVPGLPLDLLQSKDVLFNSVRHVLPLTAQHWLNVPMPEAMRISAASSKIQHSSTWPECTDAARLLLYANASVVRLDAQRHRLAAMVSTVLHSLCTSLGQSRSLSKAGWMYMMA